jgi:hypothetical protein
MKWTLQKKCLEGAQVVPWLRKAYLLKLHQMRFSAHVFVTQSDKHFLVCQVAKV